MTSSSTASESAISAATPAATSSNPFTLLSNLDSSKKYTLVFLLSVGTTLLVTGASGGRLLKRANAPAPATPAPAAAAAPSIAPLRAARPPTPSLPIASSTLSTKRPKSLLREWRTSTSSLSPAKDADYFLPNTTLLSRSAEFATELDAADRLHKDGEEDEGPYVDDGFNPAVFAAKAFAIATGITVGAFALAVGGVMSWFGVKDLESLSLALSHSLPPVLAANRPSLPAWALPSTKAVSAAGEEEDGVEHKEGVAYWVEVKETLDREAEERVVERRKAWERLKGGAKP